MNNLRIIRTSCVLLLLVLMMSFHAKSQTRKIQGKVMAFNKFPLKNIVVKAKKTKEEVLTDENGMFSISVKKNDQLTFSAKAFEKYSYRVKEKDVTLQINLIYIDNRRNADLAIENKHLSREDLQYGVENLASENNMFRNFTDIFDAITYAIPTATIIIEGGTKKVLFRGNTSSLGTNGALMLLNGVIVEDISFLNPHEVVSIEQLSSSSAALYGSRAGNGVISIVTK